MGREQSGSGEVKWEEKKHGAILEEVRMRKKRERRSSLIYLEQDPHFSTNAKLELRSRSPLPAYELPVCYECRLPEMGKSEREKESEVKEEAAVYSSGFVACFFYQWQNGGFI